MSEKKDICTYKVMMWIIQDEFAKRDHFSGNSGVLPKLNYPTHMHTFMYVFVCISQSSAGSKV